MGLSQGVLTKCDAVTLCLRGLGWPAAEVTSLPKALQTPEDREQFIKDGKETPALWAPGAFLTKPHIQLFSSPLPLTVRLATKLQLSDWRKELKQVHEKCVRGALGLGGMHDNNTVQACLSSLPETLKIVWKLRWENHWKETWYRLLLDGVPGAGGHGIVLKKSPCPCGWLVPQHLSKEEGAAAQRDHVFWQCLPAQAVRRALQHNLPEGTILQPAHLWLLQPPCPQIHSGVWAVVGLAALTIINSARRYMWAMHCHQQEDAANHRLALSPGAQAEPQHMAANRATAKLAAALWDFADTGRMPKKWEGVVTEDHLFVCGCHGARMRVNFKIP